MTKRDAFEDWVKRVRVVADLRKNSSGYVEPDIDWLWAAFGAGAQYSQSAKGTAK